MRQNEINRTTGADQPPDQPEGHARRSGSEKENNENPNNAETQESPPQLEPEKAHVFRESLRALNTGGVQYLVGATFARHHYTGIWRNTKDLDLFVKPADLSAALELLRQAGFETRIEYEHWLAKASQGEHFVDLIFGTGNGHFPIDDSFFEGSPQGRVLGVPTSLAPLEEMLASDAYIATRGRFDGGEVVHLIRSVKGRLDWGRVLRRLGENRQLLLWHLVLFDFVYPGHKDYLPQELMVQLFDEMRASWEAPVANPKAFRGALIDPFLFRVDIDEWGYEDRRQMQPLVDEKGEAL